MHTPWHIYDRTNNATLSIALSVFSSVRVCWATTSLCRYRSAAMYRGPVDIATKDVIAKRKVFGEFKLCTGGRLY